MLFRSLLLKNRNPYKAIEELEASIPPEKQKLFKALKSVKGLADTDPGSERYTDAEYEKSHALTEAEWGAEAVRSQMNFVEFKFKELKDKAEEALKIKKSKLSKEEQSYHGFDTLVIHENKEETDKFIKMMNEEFEKIDKFLELSSGWEKQVQKESFKNALEYLINRFEKYANSSEYKITGTDIFRNSPAGKEHLKNTEAIKLFRSKLDKYKTTVQEDWKEKTTLPWKKAKELGYTDGSKEKNLELFDKMKQKKFIENILHEELKM